MERWQCIVYASNKASNRSYEEPRDVAAHETFIVRILADLFSNLSSQGNETFSEKKINNETNIYFVETLSN